MTVTPNFGWTLPTVGADSNTWGTELNANLSALDTTLKTIQTTANAAATLGANTFTAGQSISNTAASADLQINPNPSSSPANRATVFLVGSASTLELIGAGAGDTNCYVGTANAIGLGFLTNGILRATIGASGGLTVVGAVTGSNLSGTSSGTNTGDQTITLTGDVTGSGTGSFATTLANTNAKNAGTNALGARTISTSAPSGTPANGDIWIQI